MVHHVFMQFVFGMVTNDRLLFSTVPDSKGTEGGALVSDNLGNYRVHLLGLLDSRLKQYT